MKEKNLKEELKQKIEKLEKELKEWEFCRYKIQQEIIKRKLALFDLKGILKEQNENIKNNE